MKKEQIEQALRVLSTMINNLATLEKSIRELISVFELEVERMELENTWLASSIFLW